MGPVQIDIQALIEKFDCDPFKRQTWLDIDSGVTFAEVAEAVQARQTTGMPYMEFSKENHFWLTAREKFASLYRTFHIQRIAHLVVHGWEDPVQIDVGAIDYYPSWPVTDGNHRFAAAVFLERPSILAEVCGSERLISRFLWKGDRTTELER